jgi:hypothetical protein
MDTDRLARIDDLQLKHTALSLRGMLARKRNPPTPRIRARLAAGLAALEAEGSQARH